MTDGNNGADHKLQAAHLLIGELMNARLDLMTQLVGLAARNAELEARIADQATAQPDDTAP